MPNKDNSSQQIKVPDEWIPKFHLQEALQGLSEGKEIYIIRHGETEFNRQGLVQGSKIDAPLNDTGRYQAKRFYEHFKHEGFNALYTSDLIRTHQSVEQFIKDGLPWTKLPGLNEISWGVNEGKVPDGDSNRNFFQLLKAWRNGYLHAAMEEGESPIQVLARQIMAVEKIMANTDEKRVLVCMHGRAMRVLLCYLTGNSLTKMDRFEHKNLCLYKLRFSGSFFEVELANFNLKD